MQWCLEDSFWENHLLNKWIKALRVWIVQWHALNNCQLVPQSRSYQMKSFSKTYKSIRLMRLLYLCAITHKQLDELECFNHTQISVVIMKCKGIFVFMLRAIAAGLSMKLIVTFETASLEQFSDSLKIVSDGNYTIDVPLFAYPP